MTTANTGLIDTLTLEPNDVLWDLWDQARRLAGSAQLLEKALDEGTARQIADLDGALGRALDDWEHNSADDLTTLENQCEREREALLARARTLAQAAFRLGSEFRDLLRATGVLEAHRQCEEECRRLWEADMRAQEGD
jgi:hypothetical protein